MTQLSTTNFLSRFRESFLEAVLQFLWRQWSALGLMGTAGVEDEWIIDPEALFVFSVGMARYEPRLFDEILGWLPTNGEWLDTARLKRMLPKDERSLRVFGGTIQWAHKMADDRKWQGLARICGDIYKNQPIADSVEVLFKEQNGTDYPLSGNNVDPSFAAYFIDRPLANPRIAMSVPMTASTNLRFLLRALLGVGSRSECIAFLLTHEAGQVHQIAGEIGFFWLSVSQTLADLTRSGLVLTRSHGKRVEYWLSQKRWWVFLTHQDADQFKPPKWVNWSAIFPALVTVWETVDSCSKKMQTEYFTASKLQQALEVLHREFSRAGVDVPPLPSMALPPDMYQKTMATFVLRLLSGKSTVKA